MRKLNFALLAMACVLMVPIGAIFAPAQSTSPASAGRSAPVLSAPGSLRPYVMDWVSGDGLSFSLDLPVEAPAGRSGFISVKDGRLAFPDGRRFRIWGVNMVGAACLPSRDDARRVARRLAQFGVNCVRLHFLDAEASKGIMETGPSGTLSFSASRLDRLDYFVAQLKNSGIYSDLTLHTGRRYTLAEGVREPDILGLAKGVTYFDPRLIQLQKEYARGLLCHRNPYTGTEYRHEPAIALIEILNENSLITAWATDELHGSRESWFDIPLYYERQLTRLYNDWLKEHLGSAELDLLRSAAGAFPGGQVPRLRKVDFAAAPRTRFHREAEFYLDIERRFFADMAACLRQDIGVKQLLVGSSDWDPRRSGYPALSALSTLDVIDAHSYWGQVNRVRGEGGGRAYILQKNRPMLNDPRNSTVVELSRSAIAGKPFIVSETSHEFPGDYACEGIPIIAAYAAFQDWDGVILYTLENSDPAEWKQWIEVASALAINPIKMPVVAAGALAFLRADVRNSRTTVERSYTGEQVIESIRLPETERPYFTPNFPPLLPLRHGVRIRSLNSAGANTFPSVPTGRIVADTGELAWETNPASAGVLTVDTPRSQFLLGFLGDKPRSTRNLVPAVNNRFCAITLSACDRRPIPAAHTLLLTATARIENSGMRWSDPRDVIPSWGTEPTLIEPVTGTIRLRGLDGARRVSVTALDGAGRALSSTDASGKAGDWSFSIGEPATTWWTITIAR